MKSKTNAQISTFTSFFADLRCENLPKVKNGRPSFSNASYFRSVVTYKCKKPYKLRGSAKRTCRATGKWDGTKTRCSKYDASNSMRVPKIYQPGHPFDYLAIHI